jgi:hypothetical protein
MNAIDAGFGLRRLDWVTFLVDDASIRAELHGMGHRLPSTVRVPVSAALELAANGLPVVINRVVHDHPA